jgi:hypothetical protein
LKEKPVFLFRLFRSSGLVDLVDKKTGCIVITIALVAFLASPARNLPATIGTRGALWDALAPLAARKEAGG